MRQENRGQFRELVFRQICELVDSCPRCRVTGSAGRVWSVLPTERGLDIQISHSGPQEGFAVTGS